MASSPLPRDYTPSALIKPTAEMFMYWTVSLRSVSHKTVSDDDRESRASSCDNEQASRMPACKQAENRDEETTLPYDGQSGCVKRLCQHPRQRTTLSPNCLASSTSTGYHQTMASSTAAGETRLCGALVPATPDSAGERLGVVAVVGEAESCCCSDNHHQHENCAPPTTTRDVAMSKKLHVTTANGCITAQRSVTSSV